MIAEEKSLLLRDLCARLPYGVNAEGEYEEDVDYNNPFPRIEKSIGHIDGIDHIGFDDGEVYVTIEGIPCELSYVKPYLRPMSNMTDEEDKEFREIKQSYYFDEDGYILFEWLNKKMFDYRGLIPMGLALEALEGMYK